MAKGVTPQSKDYSRWYTDVITKAELADYGPVKGTMVIRPYGYSIWEVVKDSFDKEFKKTGHKNAYFPLFIPKSFLSKEAEHVDGFAKECAVVTHTKLVSTNKGKSVDVDPDSKLEEEIIIRPTSETIIWSMYKKWINSYRDLPILINQWANVVRWEMRTRLFLRTSEFLWQEGHTAHSTENEAIDETLKILSIYKDTMENVLAIPVLTGYKSESEKFAGAVKTYCIEAMMGDKKALQAGTSHYLGQNFAKAFDVKYQTENNSEEYVYATSWGVSSRLIGAIIMVHGDENGLRLPPKIAPIQVVIVPIMKSPEEEKSVLNYISNLIKKFESNSIRYHIDDRPKTSPGYKFNEWEMKGVPIRIEVGPKDVNANKIILYRRDLGRKNDIDINDCFTKISELLEKIQISMLNQAQLFLDNNTFEITNWDSFKKQIKIGGFIKCGWDGKSKTEDSVKKETKATIRCIISEATENTKCVYTKEPAKFEVIYARAY